MRGAGQAGSVRGAGSGRVRLTGTGVAVLALGVLLLALGVRAGYPGLTGLGVSVLLLLVMSVAGLLVPLPLEVHRTARPLRVERLGRCTGVLEVTNTSRRGSARVQARDTVGGTPLPVDVPDLAPGAGVTVEFDVPAQRRGVVALGPLTVRRLGLALLAVRSVTRGEPVLVTVLPRVLPSRGLPSGVRRGHVGADERVERGGTDLVGLREYEPGDDLRRLHWATSARTGTLMVREDADPSLAQLTVLLDARAASYARSRDADGFEEAADTAVSLLRAAVRGGHPARLVVLGTAVDLAVPASTAAEVDTDAVLGPVLDGLAGVVPLAGGVLPPPVALHELDVLAVVTGTLAELAPLLLHQSRAAAGALLVVDPKVEDPVQSAAGSLVCRGARAEDLLVAWDLWVVA